MEDNISNNTKFSVKEIQNAFDESIPLEIKWNLFDLKLEKQITDILLTFLEKYYNSKMVFSLLYCLKELISNGEKANLKRVVFSENDLDLNNASDYKTGIENFRKYITDKRKYLSKLEKNDKYIKIIFHRDGNYFNISIINNSVISPEEKKKINFRIKNSNNINNLVEAYKTFSDNSEGAGLGLVTILIALRQIGIGSKGLKIDFFEDHTVTMISVPFNPPSREHLDIIYTNLLNEIKEIPPFPENLLELQDLISSSTSTMKEISYHISKDPILTADLIRIINSPLYTFSNKITNIFSAVKLLGFKRLRTMIYSYGTQKIIKKKFNLQKELWDHSYKTAFYARFLGNSIELDDEILDEIYLTSILHDLGKAVLNSVDPKMAKNIQLICNKKGVTTEELEQISTGIHHADLGGKILEGWNFPDEIITCVQKHHNLLVVNNDHKKILYPLFLGNNIANSNDNNISSSLLPPEILTFFNIVSQEELDIISGEMTEAFNESQL